MKKKKDKKLKEIENSKLTIWYNDGEEIGEDGRIKIKSHKEEAINEINLGSLNKPNDKIISFRYDVPRDPIKNPFKLFG